MPKHSILGLPGFLARNIPERIVCLMVLMPRWIQWYGLETIEQILRSEPQLTAPFHQGLRAGIDSLHGLLPAHPVVAWTHAMGRIEEGSADADLLRSVLELLDSASFDPTRSCSRQPQSSDKGNSGNQSIHPLRTSPLSPSSSLAAKSASPCTPTNAYCSLPRRPETYSSACA